MRSVKIHFFGWLVLALALASCTATPSINGLYETLDDPILNPEPSLIGKWEDKSGTATKVWVIEKPKDSAYSKFLVIRPIEKEGEFPILLGTVKIDGITYADLYPYPGMIESQKKKWFWQKETEIEYPDPSLFMPIHRMAKIVKTKNEVRLMFLSPQKLDSLSKVVPGFLPYSALVSGGVVFTANSQQIRSFLSKHHNNPDILTDTLYLVPSDGKTKKKSSKTKSIKTEAKVK